MSTSPFLSPQMKTQSEIKNVPITPHNHPNAKKNQNRLLGAKLTTSVHNKIITVISTMMAAVLPMSRANPTIYTDDNWPTSTCIELVQLKTCLWWFFRVYDRIGGDGESEARFPLTEFSSYWESRKLHFEEKCVENTPEDVTQWCILSLFKNDRPLWVNGTFLNVSTGVFILLTSFVLFRLAPFHKKSRWYDFFHV